MISFDQQRDMMQTLAWWKTASDADKKLVWDEIQRRKQSRVDYVMAGFEQIGFTVVLQEAERREKMKIYGGSGNGK